MVEFKADLYPLSEGVCCYCDERIPDQESRAKFEPPCGSDNGVFVMIQLTFCQPCLREIAERANDVYDAIRRHRELTPCTD